MLAVDAGSHLASIQRILQSHFPAVASRPTSNSLALRNHAPADSYSPSPDLSSESSGDSETPEPRVDLPAIILEDGPFAGLPFPYASARANAVHVVREHVSTYLITHPHLDHLSGFVINTAAFHNTSRPKRLAALPFCVNAIKQHIFNDLIWPNLTDEDNGVGLVTFQRLAEGGNLALGEGNSRGFIEVCDGLATKGFKVSHGRCAGMPRPYDYGRRGSGAPVVDAGGASQHSHSGGATHGHGHSLPQQHNGAPTAAPSTVKAPDPGGRRTSVFSLPSQPGTPTFYGGGGQQDYQHCVVDSTAYFVRCSNTGREILIFGDIEPDAISSFPRNHAVWAEAAPKIAQDILSGIFIECSYDDSVKEESLFGHLAPRHLIKELEVLAEMVAEKRKEEAASRVGRKRKRWSHQHASDSAFSAGGRKHRHTFHVSSGDEMMRDASGDDAPPYSVADIFDGPVPSISKDSSSSAKSKTATLRKATTIAPATVRDDAADDAPLPNHTGPPSLHDHGVPDADADGALHGVRVIIIHVKDTLTDGPLVGDAILAELRQHELRLAKEKKALGCIFEVCAVGASWWF